MKSQELIASVIDAQQAEKKNRKVYCANYSMKFRWLKILHQ